MSEEDAGYAVIDTETSIKNRGPKAIGTDKASPHCPENKIVHTGCYVNRWKTYFHNVRGINIGDKAKEIILVGANIKFDILYLLKDKKPDFKKYFGEMQIWDIQLAEYILSGQTSMYASLDKMSEKYGGTLKDDRLKELWNANVDTEDIADEIILPYLENDVMNTKLIFEKQIAEATERGMLKLIQTQMDALLATIEMEYNGLKFDQVGALKEAHSIKVRLAHLKKEIMGYLIGAGIEGPNPNSNVQISLFLFGGVQKVSRIEEILDANGYRIRYKTGKKAGEVRIRKSTENKVIKSIFKPQAEWETKTKGIYSVDEEVLLELKSCTSGLSILDTILEYRSLDKELNTYYLPYVQLTWPHDGCIHGKINHTSTVTGRLSSTSPNLQNITNKED